MDFTKLSLSEFTSELASKAPVPGGGGASALVGVIGAALGDMVGSLTVGKKKYAAVESDIVELKKKAGALEAELLTLMNKDAEAFEPLSKAYGLPKDTQEQREYKAQVMEEALKEACAVPLLIMEKCCEAIELLEEFAAKGSALAISDAGVGAACCRSALLGASLNVFINTKSMADRETADKMNERACAMIDKYTAKADEIFKSVRSRLE